MTDAAPAATIQVASAKWGELPLLKGREFRGAWFTVERDRLASFDHAAYIDVNDNRMADVYPDGLIEGFHQLALLDHLVNQVCFVEDPRWSGWNYGFDLIRFTSVVTVHDRIRVSGTVADVQPRGEGYLVELHCAIDIEGRDKPSCVARWKVMWVLAADDSEDTGFVAEGDL